MSSAAIATVTKMLESLPETAQDVVVDHLRQYIETVHDELKWNQSFERTRAKLSEAARHARQEIAEGQAQPMDDDQL